MTSEVKLEPTAEEIERVMADAIDVADRLIEREFGMDVPQEWNDAFRSVQEARSRNRRASPPAPAVADDPANDAAFRVLRDAGDKLSLAAQTTGGTAGRDDGLVAAIDGWTAARNKALQLRRIARYEPAPAVAVPEGWRELRDNLDRVTDHLATWAADHAVEATTETHAALYCARDILARTAAAPQPPATRSYEEGIEAAAKWHEAQAAQCIQYSRDRGLHLKRATAIRSLADEPRHGE